MSFNTQPPEGGWVSVVTAILRHARFNTQPPEGGWQVVTHITRRNGGFQHTAARRRLEGAENNLVLRLVVSTHSRPKAAGRKTNKNYDVVWFQHTAARRRLGCLAEQYHLLSEFQHTAARRRLEGYMPVFVGVDGFNTQPPEGGWWSLSQKPCSIRVSTHSRPKAAGFFHHI